MKIFLVGGAVRDKLMGIKSNDLDYVMVLEDLTVSVEAGFKIMETYMKSQGFKIFLSTPDMYTIRAKFPENHVNRGITADFVLARKELGYKEGTRQPILTIGTLFDDLLRRDFTVNAIAEDENGNIIDPFDGQADIKNKILRTPMPADLTFNDDPLRMLRALRFSLTKSFRMSNDIKNAMGNPSTIEKLKEVVSLERVREEIFKMFKCDTKETMKILINADDKYFPGLLDICFGDKMWLKPTMENK